MGALVSVVVLEKSELSPELLARIAPIWEADEATCTYRRATRTRERAACAPASGDERRGPGGPEPGTHRATAGDYGRSRIPGHFGNLMEDRCGDEVELLAQVAGSSGGDRNDQSAVPCDLLEAEVPGVALVQVGRDRRSMPARSAPCRAEDAMLRA